MKNDASFVRMRNGYWSPCRHERVKKKTPRSVEFKFVTYCHWQKRFSQNERRADLQNLASNFSIFAQRLSYELSKLCYFTPFFNFERPKGAGRNYRYLRKNENTSFLLNPSPPAKKKKRTCMFYIQDRYFLEMRSIHICIHYNGLYQYWFP